AIRIKGQRRQHFRPRALCKRPRLSIRPPLSAGLKSGYLQAWRCGKEDCRSSQTSGCSLWALQRSGQGSLANAPHSVQAIQHKVQPRIEASWTLEVVSRRSSLETAAGKGEDDLPVNLERPRSV